MFDPNEKDKILRTKAKVKEKASPSRSIRTPLEQPGHLQAVGWTISSEPKKTTEMSRNIHDSSHVSPGWESSFLIDAYFSIQNREMGFLGSCF